MDKGAQASGLGAESLAKGSREEDGEALDQEAKASGQGVEEGGAFGQGEGRSACLKLLFGGKSLRESFDECAKAGLAFLGEGTFGKCYRASAAGPTGPRDVCIKLLAKDIENEHVLAEVLALELCKGHANIVQLLDVGTSPEKCQALIFEYVGPDLRARLQGGSGLAPERGRYAQEQIRRIVWQLGGGLRHLHNAGMLHADVKPSNILTRQFAFEASAREFFNIKLADLGIVVSAFFFILARRLSIACLYRPCSLVNSQVFRASSVFAT